ncbi:hypothetical protein, partial [uncultured Gimesia sp.]|uniref:hypothetical protein n=1 Tax=uncultured Gimesia sp. TaxID=1678688 RepID=UPI0030D7B99F
MEHTKYASHFTDITRDRPSREERFLRSSHKEASTNESNTASEMRIQTYEIIIACLNNLATTSGHAG